MDTHELGMLAEALVGDLCACHRPSKHSFAECVHTPSHLASRLAALECRALIRLEQQAFDLLVESHCRHIAAVRSGSYAAPNSVHPHFVLGVSDAVVDEELLMLLPTPSEKRKSEREELVDLLAQLMSAECPQPS
jgi:hypothetical protein